MRLTDPAGSAVTLRVTGYEFPNAPDPNVRYSWHLVDGRASCREGSWSFSGPVLECDETPAVSRWLRAVADWLENPANELDRNSLPQQLAFTEPNLVFSVVDALDGVAALCVDLDYEFTPPWDRHSYAGDPFRISVRVGVEQLRIAANEWDAEAAPYPGRLTSGTS